MNIKWARRRKVSLGFHIIYLLITFLSGLAAALTLWHSWFVELPQAWLASSIIVGTLEVLALTSLILYIARVEWPLSSLRHTLPFFSILPLGYELYLLFEPNGPAIAIPIAGLLTLWCVFLSFKLLHSLEGLFIDSIQAAREAAKEEMGRVATTLARYQETKLAAESFARAVLPSEPSTLSTVPILPRRFEPVPLMLEETATLKLNDTADPRFVTIMKLAQKKDPNGQWTHTQPELQEVTRAAPELIDLVCKIVRSGQVVIT